MDGNLAAQPGGTLGDGRAKYRATCWARSLMRHARPATGPVRPLAGGVVELPFGRTLMPPARLK
jgi:hypothetical protein